MGEIAVDVELEGSVDFMRDLEQRYRKATGLADRSQYKIFYGPVRPADLLVLGKNPSGDPADVMPDGKASRSGGKPHAASAAYYENDESDLVDCDWTENRGLRKLLMPLVDGEVNALRTRVVKTNVAFRRAKKVAPKTFELWKDEAAPFLSELVGRVQPSVVLLAGTDLGDFVGRHCSDVQLHGTSITDKDVKQIVWRSATGKLRATNKRALIVQVAHASQFNWTYEKYGVADKIAALAAGG